MPVRELVVVCLCCLSVSHSCALNPSLTDCYNEQHDKRMMAARVDLEQLGCALFTLIPPAAACTKLGLRRRGPTGPHQAQQGKSNTRPPSSQLQSEVQTFAWAFAQPQKKH